MDHQNINNLNNLLLGHEDQMMGMISYENGGGGNLD